MFNLSKPAITMTSLELVKFINENDKRRLAVLRHDHFLSKVPDVLGETVAPNFRGYYIAENGKQNPMYVFPKREACLMAMSYSYELQAMVYDRMTALEERQPDPMQILADPVAMRSLLLGYAEKVIALEGTVAEQAPKVEALDRIATKTAGSMCITDAAKVLQVKRSELIKFFEVNRWCYRRPGSARLRAYDDKRHSYLLEHKLVTFGENDTQMDDQVLVTPKGLAKLTEIFSAGDGKQLALS